MEGTAAIADLDWTSLDRDGAAPPWRTVAVWCSHHAAASRLKVVFLRLVNQVRPQLPPEPDEQRLERELGIQVELLELAPDLAHDHAGALRAGEPLERLDLTQRDADQRLRRAQRGAEREELLASLEELAAWYRDLVVVATGAQSAAIHSDRLDELGEDATLERLAGAERACEVVRQVWRELEEFNLNPELALEALFVRLRRELGANLVYEA